MGWFSKKKASRLPGSGNTHPLFPDGIEILHDPSDAIVDVCFVHGLTGNRRSTWTARGQSSPWPEGLLPTRLEGARLMTWGYDAYFVRPSVAGINSLAEHASNLIADLADERIDHPARPLILVAHSLGGLVCKRALLAARNNADRHLREIFEAAKGIIFLGTPHRGSWMADRGKFIAYVLSFVKSTNRSLLQILETNDRFSRAIHHDFLNMLRGLPAQEGREVKVICFYEELPMPRVGVIVSRDSATFPGYQQNGIHANHSNMVKFASPEDIGFKLVLAGLGSWTNECRRQTQPAATDADTEKAVNDMLSATIGPSVLCERVRDFLDLTTEDFSDAALRRLTTALGIEGLFRKLLGHENALRHLTSLVDAQPDCQPSVTSKIIESRPLLRSIKAEIHNLIASKKECCLQSLACDESKLCEAKTECALHDDYTWIYQHETYKWWRNTHSGLLWIKGKPESGTSALMKSLSAEWRMEAENDTPDERSSIVLEFSSNARGSAFGGSSEDLYHSLVHDLVTKDLVSMLRLLPHFLEKESRVPSSPVVWTWLELAELFHKELILQQPNAVVIFIDATDDCGVETVQKVVHMFEDTLKQAASHGPSVHVCWTSRHDFNISVTTDLSCELRLEQHTE